jgi:hypothetical protein
MHAGPMTGARVRRVGSGQDRNVARLKLTDGFLCVGERPVAFWKWSRQVLERVLADVWLELGIISQRLA